MLQRDADATRKRLIEAATAEFAAYGIAGARVDRIAAAARSNKAQIYHYFGSKDGLLDAVFSTYVEASVDDHYFDAGDLPETAGRIFDDFVARPELSRLTGWYRMERTGTSAQIAALAASSNHKIALIAAAQQAGTVSRRFPAPVLYGLVLTLAMARLDLPPEFAAIESDLSPAERRAVVVESVRRLVTD